MAGNPTESQLPKGADWVSRDIVQNLAFVDVYRLLDSSDYGSLSYSCLIATIEVILLAILADKVSIKPLMQGRCDVRLQDGPGSPEH